MKRRWMFPMAFLALVLTGFEATRARDARAEELGDVAVLTGEGFDSPSEADRWWGAAGAALCGMEGRLIRVAPEIGMNPYVLAAGIGGCLLAIMDIATT